MLKQQYKALDDNSYLKCGMLKHPSHKITVDKII